jgi:hypothetical protein
LRIITDYREKSSGMIELLSEHCGVEVATLPFDDYLINDRFTVERKTARDFLVSIIDLRLFKQMADLKKNVAGRFCSSRVIPMRLILVLIQGPYEGLCLPFKPAGRCRLFFPVQPGTALTLWCLSAARMRWQRTKLFCGAAIGPKN